MKRNLFCLSLSDIAEEPFSILIPQWNEYKDATAKTRDLSFSESVGILCLIFISSVYG